MNKFEKCKKCDKYKTCDYIKYGETCNLETYMITTNESTFEYTQGKTQDIELKHDDCDVRLDLVVEKKKVSKLWGQVKDTSGEPIEGALVTLFKPQYIRGKVEYFDVSAIVSDSLGFYNFEINKLEKGLKYKVSVSKSQ